jgi:hypothetical protein
MAGKVFAVLAAIFLVGAFALATLAAPDMPLGEGLYELDHGALDSVRAAVTHHLSPWVWKALVTPLLIRPVWLIPAALGLLFTGAALTATSHQAHRSRRRS